MSRLIDPLLALLAAVCLSAPSFAAVNDAAVKTPWGYKGHLGPKYWGQLSPKFIQCGAGRMQSPIDIAKNDAEVPNTLTLNYHPAPLYIVDDGTTRLQIDHEYLLFNDGHALQVNFNQVRAKETIVYEGEEYSLVQFHFHSPSENQINGENAPLEIHFVHQSKQGHVVVISVFVKGGESNPVIQSIVAHLPRADGKVSRVPGVTIHPRDLFPKDNDYYSFMGSLTTPPCTEGLKWVVMAGTMTATPAQIASIRNTMGGSNIRPVQPLNKRIVSYSMGKKS